MLAETELSWIDPADLVAPLRTLTGEPFHAIEPRRCQRLTGGLGGSRGVWRLEGQASTDDHPVSWTLILKGWALPSAEADYGTWDTPY